VVLCNGFYNWIPLNGSLRDSQQVCNWQHEEMFRVQYSKYTFVTQCVSVCIFDDTTTLFSESTELYFKTSYLLPMLVSMLYEQLPEFPDAVLAGNFKFEDRSVGLPGKLWVSRDARKIYVNDVYIGFRSHFQVVNLYQTLVARATEGNLDDL
jgi:hypothetical protein